MIIIHCYQREKISEIIVKKISTILRKKRYDGCYVLSLVLFHTSMRECEEIKNTPRARNRKRKRKKKSHSNPSFLLLLPSLFCFVVFQVYLNKTNVRLKREREARKRRKKNPLFFLIISLINSSWKSFFSSLAWNSIEWMREKGVIR